MSVRLPIGSAASIWPKIVRRIRQAVLPAGLDQAASHGKTHEGVGDVVLRVATGERRDDVVFGTRDAALQQLQDGGRSVRDHGIDLVRA
jgi:hypothetical protein